MSLHMSIYGTFDLSLLASTSVTVFTNSRDLRLALDIF